MRVLMCIFCCVGLSAYLRFSVVMESGIHLIAIYLQTFEKKELVSLNLSHCFFYSMKF